MISARSLRNPSPSTAAVVRLAAFLVAAVSVVLIPVEFCAAASHHASVPAAFEIAALAVVLTLLTAFAARSLDPIRR